MAPWPLDGGAELIAGEHSIVKQIADAWLPMHVTESEFANFVFWSDSGELAYLFDGHTPLHDQITNLVDTVRFSSCLFMHANREGTRESHHLAQHGP